MMIREVRELATLPRRFDLFRRMKVDKELVKAGLHPPLPIAKGYLIWGFNILEAAQESGLAKLPCSEISGGDGELLLTALRLEHRPGSYDWNEQLAVAALAEQAEGDELRAKIAAMVDPSGGFPKKVELFRSLAPGLKQLVAGRKIDISTAQRLSGLPETVCDVVLAMSPLSLSNNRIFLTAVGEIILRDGLSAEHAKELTEALLTEPDPVASVFKRRNPRLAEMEATLAKFSKEKLRGCPVDLRAPANFEGERFSVSFRFDGPSALSAAIKCLGRVEAACDELFSLLR